VHNPCGDGTDLIEPGEEILDILCFESVLPRITIIRILPLPTLDIVLLVLHCFLAHLVLMPLMSSNAPADGPEHAMLRHMTRQGSRSGARYATDSVR
jgi:hypothetical protein